MSTDTNAEIPTVDILSSGFGSSAAKEDGETNPRPVMLALQGGGSHSAFTWGVLDYLLDLVETHKIKITAVCGTSGGALNAAVLAHGLQVSPERARVLLKNFWGANSIAAHASLNPFSIPFPVLGSWNIDFYPWVTWLHSLGLVLSPYYKAPGRNFLKEVVEEHIDFDILNMARGPKVFVVSTNVRTGRWKTFKKGELSADSLLASACLPTVFPAVTIDQEPHWDGGYVKDPGLFPMVNDHTIEGTDIIIVGVNPFNRGPNFLPTTPWEIADRVNEISFNSSLMGEVEKILLVNSSIPQDPKSGAAKVKPRSMDLEEGDKRYLHMHYLEPPAEMSRLGLASKANASYPFASYLRDIGHQAMKDWWPSCFANLGVCHTDIGKIVDYECAGQPMTYHQRAYSGAMK